MGNLKAKLHLNKDKNRPNRADNDTPVSENQSAVRTQVDQQIISGNTNRARVAEVNSSANVPTTTRGATEPPQPTTTARART